MSPLFSVLIANFNNGRFIDDAIESVLKQTYLNWEIVIVDDASTDDSVKLLNKWREKDKRIRIFVNEINGGCGFTKRRCAEVAQGEICGFLDPDDALTPHALELSVKTHLQNPQASLVYSNCFICKDDLEVIRKKIVNSVPEGSNFLDSFGLDEVACSHFATYKRAYYVKTDGIDSYCRRAVDQDMYFKLEEVGKLIHIDDALYYYRMHEGGLSLGANSIKAISWFMYVIIETCKRRGLQLENYLPDLIKREVVKPIYKKKDFKVGQAVLKPFRSIKNLGK